MNPISQSGGAVLRFAARSLVLPAAVCVWLCLGPVAAARAQVAGSSGKELGTLSVYGMVSADRNQFRQYANFPKSLGYTAGATINHKGLFGITFEGSAIKYRSRLHDYTALAGPRVSYRFGRFRPYGEGLFGIGHGSYVVLSGLPAIHTTQSFGIAYAVAGGVDLRITHHFSWRMVQANYTHISAGEGVTTETGSTGVVYRF